MLSLRLFRPGVPKEREEKAFLSIKRKIHLIEGAIMQQPNFFTAFQKWHSMKVGGGKPPIEKRGK